jgi:periplasmic protein TonB
MTNGLYFTESRELRIFRWTMAVVFAAVLHVGAALALMQWRDEEISNFSGSIALELAPKETPAPPMDYKESQQEEVKRVKEVAAVIPTVAPSPLAPNPEVQVPIREEEKEKPKEKDPEITSTQNVPEIQRDTVTTSPPPSEAKLSPTPTARVPGLLANDAKAIAMWRNELFAHIDHEKRWPTAARAHDIQGEVTLEFTVDRAGRVVNSRVLHGSGFAVLDDEAMSTLKRATPLPMPPAQVSDETLHLTLPIRFRR